MIVLASFLILAAMTFAVRKTRQAALGRSGGEWLLDAVGLMVQGIVIPLLQTTLIYGLFSLILPQAKGTLDVHPLVAFLLNFVAIDYLYYWNHRLLHSRKLWDTHAVHHTAERMDLFITSRNTLWSSLLIVYVWVNGFFIFLLKNPRAFILSVAITASLDLWRHTAFTFKPDSRLHQAMAFLFITPNEHAWHHSTNKPNKNFGANLSIWDKLHGSYFSPAQLPKALGIPTSLTLTRKLLFPFQTRKAADSR
jgi:sterol desaturase/sphingolipid hydroxylase (fatty acid hydroxylase superfamily)